MRKIRPYQLGIYEKAMPPTLSFKEMFGATQETGFDYFEMSIDESDYRLDRLNMSKKDRRDLLKDAQDKDVFIRSICLSGHRKYPMGSKDSLTRERSMDIMYKAIDLASYLGVRLIQLAGYDVYYDEGDARTKELFFEGLKKSVERAASMGISLGFETMETGFMDTVSKAMKYVTKINSPWLGVYPDIGNLMNASKLYKTDFVEDLLSGKGHIMAVHLKETRPGVYRNLNFGDGHTNYSQSIDILRDLGVRQFLGEMWYVDGSDWFEKLKQANKFLRKHLDYSFTYDEDKI